MLLYKCKEIIMTNYNTNSPGLQKTLNMSLDVPQKCKKKKNSSILVCQRLQSNAVVQHNG